MKKILIPTFLILAAMIGGVVFAISFSYNNVQYGKDIIAHCQSLDNGELVAEYHDQTTYVQGKNVDRICKVISISARKRFYIAPKYDEADAIYLTFPNGARYILVPDDSNDDAIFLLYYYKNKKNYYSISGYNSMGWATRAISPEGIAVENTVVD